MRKTWDDEQTGTLPDMGHIDHKPAMALLEECTPIVAANRRHQLHFNPISTPFQPHFSPISIPFQPHFNPVLNPFKTHLTPFQRCFRHLHGLLNNLFRNLDGSVGLHLYLSDHRIRFLRNLYATARLEPERVKGSFEGLLEVLRKKPDYGIETGAFTEQFLIQLSVTPTPPHCNALLTPTPTTACRRSRGNDGISSSRGCTACWKVSIYSNYVLCSNYVHM